MCPDEACLRCSSRDGVTCSALPPFATRTYMTLMTNDYVEWNKVPSIFRSIPSGAPTNVPVLKTFKAGLPKSILYSQTHTALVQNRDRMNGVTRRPSHQQPFQEDKEHQSGAPSQHQRNGGSNHQRQKSMSPLEPQEHDVEHSNKRIGMDHQTWLCNRQKQTTLPIIILPEGEEREKKEN